MVRKLTLRRILNFLKLYAGFHWSRVTRRPVQLGMPFFLSVEPTTSCNLRCPQCPSGLREFTRPTGMLDESFFKNVLKQVASTLHSLTFYFQGEPYLNPSFLKMVRHAADKNVFTITSTNGHYLTEQQARNTVESGLDKLIISIDGLTQEVYEEYRIGGKVEKVIQGTKNVLAQKKLLRSRTPHVVWQFVVFRQNEHQVDSVRKLAKELGVDEVRIKTAQIYDFQNSQELIPLNETYSRYRKNEAGEYEIRNKLLNQCWRMWQGCVITWDGKVVPCCFDKDAHHQVGALSATTFREIWWSPAYERFRSSVLTGRKEIDICVNCSEGTKVWT